MKTLTLLKMITVTLAICLVAGIGFIGYKITDIRIKSKPSSLYQETFKLHFPENISSVLTCGDKLCLMTVGHDLGHRLLIVNPDTGRVQSVLTFQDKPSLDIN